MLTYYVIDYFSFLSQFNSNSCSFQLSLGADELVGVSITEFIVQIRVSTRHDKQIVVADRVRYPRCSLSSSHPVLKYLSNTLLL